MRSLFVLIALGFLLFPITTLAVTTCGADAQSSDLTTVSRDDAGVFMQDICQVCWEQGNCGLQDLLVVVANIANFILEIVGVLVFLFYIIGGFLWIMSRGEQGLVTQGKKMIKGATAGLIIVLVAYSGVVALRTALMGQGLSSGYVICDGTSETNGQPCGLNSECSGFACLSGCEARGGSCVDASQTKALEEQDENIFCEASSDCSSTTQECCLPLTTIEEL